MSVLWVGRSSSQGMCSVQTTCNMMTTHHAGLAFFWGEQHYTFETITNSLRTRNERCSPRRYQSLKIKFESCERAAMAAPRENEKKTCTQLTYFPIREILNGGFHYFHVPSDHYSLHHLLLYPLRLISIRSIIIALHLLNHLLHLPTLPLPFGFTHLTFPTEELVVRFSVRAKSRSDNVVNWP